MSGVEESYRYAVLVGYPLRLWQRQQQHNDELLREFTLLVIGNEIAPSSAPARLVQLAQGMIAKYGGLVDEIQRTRLEAFERGDLTIDSRVPLVPDAVPLMQGYRAVFEEVDAFCRAGQLLALPTPPELVALRDWSTGEIIAQAAGEPPTPWSGPLE
jgi:hypothetical protein